MVYRLLPPECAVSSISQSDPPLTSHDRFDQLRLNLSLKDALNMSLAVAVFDKLDEKL